MATGLKYYFGIDFGTTNSATVGYVVMDQKPEAVKYGDEERTSDSVRCCD